MIFDYSEISLMLRSRFYTSRSISVLVPLNMGVNGFTPKFKGIKIDSLMKRDVPLSLFCVA